MASLFKLGFLMLVLHFCAATATEFLVGGVNGTWGIPKSRNEQEYNQWASKNRFKVDDTVHFKYKKDSVLVVTEEEYEKCRSSHPLFFSNNDDTVFTLDRPGLFYFISGVDGHCERGQKMIIKVLQIESPPPQPGNDTGSLTTTSSVAALAAISVPTVTAIAILTAALFVLIFA
ncbi:early nodulin-like protein 1 [Tripterygium wilfordii]|uniref:Early nodulin-like protein 1 n=1 Tax=Tripterygium wilfordii TaxID=458696 RepID=A0A7J7CJA8_TRIWF|nr:early nodulin-like protein 1 [Tripterygium wilfordii]KAF5734086.1 early nodulin-like protein 1 [Tripterygium wilfordii]